MTQLSIVHLQKQILRSRVGSGYGERGGVERGRDTKKAVVALFEAQTIVEIREVGHSAYRHPHRCGAWLLRLLCICRQLYKRGNMRGREGGLLYPRFFVGTLQPL